MAARMAMMTMTMRSSMRVKAGELCLEWGTLFMLTVYPIRSAYGNVLINYIRLTQVQSRPSPHVPCRQRYNRIHHQNA